jgi:uncharacterized protein YndB with AHSA1/START domain
MNTIKQTYLIDASPRQVWHALTDPRLIEKWSGASATFEPEVGTDYSLWDGSIVGGILDVVPNEILVQTWKPSDWTIDNSVVTFTLTKVGNKTQVDLLHENVEEFDYEGTTKGWDIYYLGAIKKMLEENPGNTNAGTTKSRNTKTAKTAKGNPVAKKKVVAKKSVKKTSPQK